MMTLKFWFLRIQFVMVELAQYTHIFLKLNKLNSRSFKQKIKLSLQPKSISINYPKPPPVQFHKNPPKTSQFA